VRHLRLRILVGLACCALVLLSSGAEAGAPRVVLADNINATWCPNCPWARCALELLAEEFPDQLLIAEHHHNDALATPWTEARKAFYDISGLPLVMIDGVFPYIGASSCEFTASRYRTGIELRLALDGGTSPVRIEGFHRLVPAADAVAATATLRLEDAVAPEDLEHLEAFLLLLEDEVEYGGHTYHHVTRAAHAEAVELNAPGDLVTVSAELTLSEVGDPSQIDVIAFLQRVVDPKEVLQAARLSRLADIPSDDVDPGHGAGVRLARVGPNPFLPATGTPLSIELEREGDTVPARFQLNLLDATGRARVRLYQGTPSAGQTTITWAGSGGLRDRLPAGVYFLRFQGGGQAQARTLIIAR